MSISLCPHAPPQVQRLLKDVDAHRRTVKLLVTGGNEAVVAEGEQAEEVQPVKEPKKLKGTLKKQGEKVRPCSFLLSVQTGTRQRMEN